MLGGFQPSQLVQLPGGEGVQPSSLRQPSSRNNSILKALLSGGAQLRGQHLFCPEDLRLHCFLGPAAEPGGFGGAVCCSSSMRRQGVL